MKVKKEQEIAKLIELLGGAENIAVAAHCVSRLRLVMKEMSLVKDAEIRKLDLVKGTIKLQHNQYHVVIGTDVPDVYKEFVKIGKIGEASKEDVKKVAAASGNWLQRAMQHFSEIFIPIIPVLVASGIILGIRNIFEADFDGYVIAKEIKFFGGLNDFLWIPAQAGLWFLPVYICWSIFKKMGGTPALGIFIGLTLLLPPLINVYEVKGDSVQWIWDKDLSKFGFDFGDWKFPWKIAYTAQVIPAIGVAFAGIYIERYAKKWLPSVIHQIFVPLITVLGAYTLGLMAIGPIGWTIGTAISYVVNWALTQEVARYFFAPVFGLLYAPLVVTGMHHMLNAVMIQEVANNQGTIFFPILALSNIAQGAAVIGYMIMRRTEKTKQVGASALTSAWLGVTEPAMYGVNLRYFYPFIAAIVGTAVGALFVVIFGVSAAGIGNGAWLGTLSIQAKSPISGYTTVPGTGYTWFIIAGVLTTGIAIGGTMLLSRVKRFKTLEAKVGPL